MAWLLWEALAVARESPSKNLINSGDTEIVLLQLNIRKHIVFNIFVGYEKSYICNSNVIKSG